MDPIGIIIVSAVVIIMGACIAAGIAEWRYPDIVQRRK